MPYPYLFFNYKGEIKMLKEKLNEMKSNSEGIELFVIEDILKSNESNAEISKYIHTVLNYGCSSDCVTSLIDYGDTKEFFTKFQDEILAMLDELNKEWGISFEINTSNLAWFGYVETMKDIATELNIW